MSETSEIYGVSKTEIKTSSATGKLAKIIWEGSRLGMISLNGVIFKITKKNIYGKELIVIFVHEAPSGSILSEAKKREIPLSLSDLWKDNFTPNLSDGVNRNLQEQVWLFLRNVMISEGILSRKNSPENKPYLVTQDGRLVNKIGTPKDPKPLTDDFLNDHYGYWKTNDNVVFSCWFSEYDWMANVIHAPDGHILQGYKPYVKLIHLANNENGLPGRDFREFLRKKLKELYDNSENMT